MGLQDSHADDYLIERFTIGVPSLSALLSSFQAKAAVTTQLVSAQLHSHHFFPMHRKDGSGPPINDEEIDSEDEDEYGNMAGRETVYEEQNVDWFFEIISTVNHAQAAENSCSPYHPDDVSADAEEGHPANPVLPYKQALDVGIESLNMAVMVRMAKKRRMTVQNTNSPVLFCRRMRPRPSTSSRAPSPTYFSRSRTASPLTFLLPLPTISYPRTMRTRKPTLASGRDLLSPALLHQLRQNNP